MEQEAAQQGVDSKPGVPNEAEAMEGTDQEAEQQGLDSKPGVPDEAVATPKNRPRGPEPSR